MTAACTPGVLPGTQRSSISGQLTGGVVSPIRIGRQRGGLVNFTNAGGMFVAGGQLWFASRHLGALYVANWNGATVTSRAVRAGSTT